MSEQGDLRTALGELRPSRKVRAWIEEMDARGALSGDDLDRLLAAAYDCSMWRWRDRAAVCWYLGRIEVPAERRYAVLEALADALANVSSGAPQRTGRWALRAASAAALIGLLAGLLGPGSTKSWLGAGTFGLVASAFSLVPLLVLSYPSSHFVDEERLNRVRRQAALSLSAFPMPEALAPVVDAALTADVEVRRPALLAALGMLDATTTQDYGRLGVAVPGVCRLLESTRGDGLVHVIDALGRFGDGRAVEPIERMVRSAADAPQVLDAANRALPILRERQRLEREASRLLRPSQAPAADGSALLRPALGSEAVDAEVLLRPAGPVEGE